MRTNKDWKQSDFVDISEWKPAPALVLGKYCVRCITRYRSRFILCL